MSHLRDALAAQNALCPPVIRCVETASSPVTMVIFCPWQAKEWTLPWSRLDAVGFSDEQELERVELLFPHHHVTMVGENLRGIMDDIRSFRVRALRDLPVSHRATLKPGAVFITQLEVRLLAEPKSLPQAGIPS